MKLLAIAAAVTVASSASAGTALPQTTLPTAGPAAESPVIYFLPLGKFPTPLLAELVEHTRAKLGLRVSVLAGLQLPPNALDDARKQYVADELLSRLERVDAGDRRQTVVIGLTSADMFTRLKSWRYTFALRDGVRYAVVSTARMDDRFYGLGANEYLLRSRLEKMVTKQIGVLHWRLSLSSNPRSVLFDTILSLGDLDYMTEEFRPASYSGEKQSWLRRAGSACNTANQGFQALVAAHPPRTLSDIRDLLTKALPLEQRLTSQLVRLRRPQQDAQGTARFLKAVQAATQVDQAASTRLRAKWDLAYFQHWRKRNADLNFVARSLALAIGTRACAAVFYPTG